MTALSLYILFIDVVLGFCGGSQVSISIVEAVMVYMVNDERIWRDYYFAVHFNSVFFLVYSVPGTTGGVKGA